MQGFIRNSAFAVAAVLFVAFCAAPRTAAAQGDVEFRTLATLKMSTMEDELNTAAEQGFRFQSAMGGETALGGDQVVAVLSRVAGARGRFDYRLLATLKTSTMEKELQAAADQGFDYRAQTVFKTALGGEQVVCILERDKDAAAHRSQYKVVATLKTSTLEKELQEAGEAGYQIVGLTVAKTALGGKEIVSILRRDR